MSDGDALLAAICAQPEEDVPRLAYADWLDETGDPANARYARYIRAAVRLARPSLSPPRRPSFLKFLFGMGVMPAGTQRRLEKYKQKRDEFWRDRDERITAGRVRDAEEEWAVSEFGIFALQFAVGVEMQVFFPSFQWNRGFPERWSGEMNHWMVCGPHLVRRFPLTALHVEDQRPWQGEYWVPEGVRNPPNFWTYVRYGSYELADDDDRKYATIPAEIFRCLPGAGPDARFWCAPDHDVAPDRALELAMLSWAREEAV